MTREVADTESGFTLLEMLVALLLMALVGASLTMILGQTPRQANPREIARLIAGEARLAWRLAATTGRDAVFSLDLLKRTVTVYGRPEKIVLPERLPISMTTADRLVDEGKVGKIIFFPDGSSTGGEIVVGSAQRGGYQVRIFWMTGTIETRRLQ